MKILGYWGKAQDGWHPLPAHCLDVAACAVTLLEHNHRLAGTLARVARLEVAELRKLAGWAATLHDLGKLSPGFQWKVPELARQLGQPPLALANDVRHDSLGWALWHDDLGAHSGLDSSARVCADIWMRCATGHHGIPPSRMPSGRPIRLRKFFREEDIAAGREWLAFADLLFQPSWQATEPESLRRASFWIAGLVTLSDWLGSSREWFPYQPTLDDLDTYWTQALTRAEKAVVESGLAADPTTRGFAQLFPEYRPTPVQEAVNRLSPDGPFLLVIEEVTGGGKSEAAFAAAGGDGFFFGLPTMATANGLWRRVKSLGGQQALVHAKRWLLPAAMERAEAWLNDSSRTALLASIGVGTIDQAMLAVLQARYAALRLAGLAGRTLIIDEVHAYDPYMGRILELLVEFQALSGGNVVLLSATMPLAVRQGFLDAWRRGRGLVPALFNDPGFPLVSWSDDAGVHQVPVAAASDRRVRVERETSIDAVAARVRAASATGQCVVWIRNTVREAVEAFDLLSRAGLTADLFHARFAQGDRLAIEDRVVGTFGKHSTPEQRAGRILVATQVVEQSLDLDFDLMVTDLAPIDLVIQRAGRLHRHPRGDRGVPTLVVFGPTWTEAPDPDWVTAWSSSTGFVYPDHGQLWLTMQLLGGGIDLPRDSRSLVEGVFGDGARGRIPPGLSGKAADAGRERERLAGLARANVVPVTPGYQTDGQTPWDDEDAPTRLGGKTREWVLCEDGKPIFGDDIALSVVSVRASALSRAPEAPGVKVGPWRRTLNLSGGKAVCERANRDKADRLLVRYDRLRGLVIEG